MPAKTAAPPVDRVTRTVPGEPFTQLDELALQDLSIEDLMKEFERLGGAAADFEVQVGSTGGSYPLPVLEIVPEGDEPVRRNAQEMGIAPPESFDPSLASRLAMLRQDLAAFGADAGQGDMEARREFERVSSDFFA